MKKIYLYLLALLLPLTAIAAIPTRIDNDVIIGGTLTPKVNALDLGSTSFRWDAWLNTINGAAIVTGARLINTTTPLQGGGDLSADRTLSILQSGAAQDGYLSSTDWNTFNNKEPAITVGTAFQYWRGDKTFQTLDTLAVPENTNLYYTQGRFDTAFSGKSTTDLSEGTNLYFTDTRARTAVVDDAIVDSVTNKAPSQNAVFDALAGKEPTVTGTTAADYYRGDKTFQTLDTLAVPENTNLYFTDTRARTAAVADSITDGVTNIAPSQNAVFDALVLKADDSAVVKLAGTQTVTGEKTFTAAAKLNLPAIPQVSDSSTGNIDALDTSANVAVRLTGAAPVLRGVANGADGKLAIVVNASGVDVLVENEDAAPTAANRIITGTGADLTLANTASIWLQYDATSSRWRIIGGSGSGGGSGEAVVKEHTQTAHGFSVGNVVRFDGTDWVLSDASADATSEVFGIVSTVVDANTFQLTSSGYISGLSGLTAGAAHFLSETAGAITATAPTAASTVNKPVVLATSTTEGYVIHARGYVNGGSGGGTTKFWNGYLDSTCLFTAVTGYPTLADFNDDASCTLVQTYNNGMGTVTRSANKPGITFTAPDTGYIETCAQAPMDIGTSNAYIRFELTDGTNSSIHTFGNSGNTFESTHLCVVTQVTSGNSYTIKFRGVVSSGIGNLNGGGTDNVTFTSKYL